MAEGEDVLQSSFEKCFHLSSVTAEESPRPSASSLVFPRRHPARLAAASLVVTLS